jgi:hypothetical protein
MSHVKYTNEDLSTAASRSTTWMGMMRELGANDRSGGLTRHIKERVLSLGIDTSHFLGLRHNLGEPPKNRKSSEVILRDGYSKRVPGHQLRRALLEVGIPHKCAECGLGPEWNGKALYLPVDHVDGNWKDNRLSNLRFLCPNCHWQTPTFGNRSRE